MLSRPAQKLFLRHAVEGDLRILLRSIRLDRGRRRLRLVHLDVFLQRVDQILVQILRRNGLVGDFAERKDRILVVFA